MEMSVNNFSKDTFFFVGLEFYRESNIIRTQLRNSLNGKSCTIDCSSFLLCFFFLLSFSSLLGRLFSFAFFFDKTLASFSCQYSIYLLPFDLVVNTQNVGQGTAAPKPISSRMSVLCMWCCGWAVFSM